MSRTLLTKDNISVTWEIIRNQKILWQEVELNPVIKFHFTILVNWKLKTWDLNYEIVKWEIHEWELVSYHWWYDIKDLLQTMWYDLSEVNISNWINEFEI